MQSFIDFTPAQVAIGKQCFIVYYVKNPITNKLQRKRIKLNYIKPAKERLKFARKVAADITIKLYSGWNPFVEDAQKNGYITIQEAIEQFIKEKSKELRPDSLRCYISFTKIFMNFLIEKNLQNIYVQQFRNKEVQMFLNKIEENTATITTYNKYVKFMRTIFFYFIEKKYIKENPFKDAKIKRNTEPKKRTIIPKDVRNKITKYLFENEMVEFYYFMQFTYKMLIRPKESLMLKIKDIDFYNGFITVPDSVSKNHYERVLAVPQNIMQFLERYRDKDKFLYIFSENYKPGKILKNTRDSGRTWDKIRKSLNLPSEYQFYSLKDTAITEMLNAGVPAKVVQNLADHHDLSMTEKYSHKISAKEILKYDCLEF